MPVLSHLLLETSVALSIGIWRDESAWSHAISSGALVLVCYQYLCNILATLHSWGRSITKTGQTGPVPEPLIRQLCHMRLAAATSNGRLAAACKGNDERSVCRVRYKKE
jgi:hypothetical protein